jgi:Ca-activated chloride channel family protein
MAGLLVSLAALLLLGAAPPGSPAPPRFAGGTSLVVLTVSAVDDHGHPVDRLRASDFQVLEDGRPQAITYFAHGQDAPAHVVLLVDRSGSMADKDKSAGLHVAASQVLAGLAPADEVALAGFDQDFELVVPFTRDHARVLAAVDGLSASSFGATALHDSLTRAAELAATAEGRRAVIVLTDGVDNASVTTPGAALARAQALEVPLYAVSVISPIDDPSSSLYAPGGDRRALEEGRAVLDRYATFSGGAAFTVSDLLALEKAAGRVLGEIKQQYRLGYDPPAGPPGFRKVDVRTRKKGVRIRARNGYLARS